MGKVKSIFNTKVLADMIRENIRLNDDVYYDNDLDEKIYFDENAINEITSILSEIVLDKKGISLEDVDKSIDYYLYKKGYVYDSEVSQQYVLKSEKNYYYYRVVELEYSASAKSLTEVMSESSRVLEENLRKLQTSLKVKDDMVTINIVKDNSTRYVKDENLVLASGVYNLETDNLCFNINNLLKNSI